MIVTCLLCAIILLIYIYVKQKHSYWTRKGIKQCEPAFLFGNLFDIVIKRCASPETVNSIYSRYPESSYVGFYQFLLPTLMIRDTDLIKQIAIKDFEHFTDHRLLVEDSDEWNAGVFSLKGERWKEMRATLGPVFTSNKMRVLFELVDDCGRNFADYFVSKTKYTVAVELQDVFSRVISDVIAATVFGITSDSLREPKNKFYEMGAKASSSPVGFKTLLLGCWPGLSKFISVFPADVSQFLKQLVTSCIDYRERNNVTRPDLIHILLEAKKGLLTNDVEDSDVLGGKTDFYKKFKKSAHRITDDDIVSQCFVFFFAGFETSTTLLTFAGYELAINQSVQMKLREEIVRETNEEPDRMLTYDCLMRMKYLEMVLLETLRKYPPIPFIDRNCVKPYDIDTTKSGGKTLRIEKNDSVWFPVYALHRDARHFPDPNKFDPERFNDANRKSINTYAFLPFGIGPRSCIGSRFALLQAKVTLVHLLKRFELIVIDKTPIPLEFSTNHINLHPRQSVHVGFRALEE